MPPHRLRPPLARLTRFGAGLFGAGLCAPALATAAPLAAPDLIADPVAQQDAPSPAPPDTPAASTPAATGPAAGMDLPPKDHNYDGDYVIVGAGVAMAPQYEGARKNVAMPGGGIYGRVGKISFSPRAPGLAVYYSPLPSGSRVTFGVGPVVRYSANRHGSIDDPVVAALGKLPITVEGGVAASVSVHRLLSPADSLSLSTDVRWDVTGHSGRIISPSIGYYTPISKGILIGGSAGVEFVDGKYASFAYDVTPAGSLASGLPVYNAHSGLKDYNAQAFAAVDLDGDLLDGGFALLFGVSWTRLTGSAADTPIVALRGKRDQVAYGAGIAYSF